MTGWDGKERRREGYHEILIRIDANLDNAIKTFIKHEISDQKNFDDLFKRISMVEKICYGIGGVIVFIEILAKVIR